MASANVCLPPSQCKNVYFCVYVQGVCVGLLGFFKIFIAIYIMWLLAEIISVLAGDKNESVTLLLPNVFLFALLSFYTL